MTMTDSETVENDVSNTDSPENGASNTTFNIATVIQDTKKVLLTPVTFYREMPTSGGFSDPIIFVIVMAVASGILTSILSIIESNVA